MGCRAGTLSLSDPRERELLIQGAWDRSVVRFSSTKDPVSYQPLKVPVVLSATGMILSTMGIVGGTLGGIVIIAPWLLVPVLTSPSTRKLFAGVRFRKGNRDSMHQGVITGSSSMQAPASGRECVAFAIRLTHGPSQSHTLVDAFSSGFDVKLSNGRVAHIPKGRIRVQGSRAVQLLPPDTHMPRWWQLVDPNHESYEPRSPYPHSEIQEEVLTPGQSLVLQNELVMTTRQHRGADYRDASANILEPRGVPHIKIVQTKLNDES